MKNILFLISMLIISSVVFGQTQRTPAIKISDVGIYQGMTNNYNSNASLTDFLRLAPESSLLQNDFLGFTKSTFYIGPTTADNMFTVNLGLLFYNHDKQDYNSNPKLNIGVSFIGATSLDAYYNKSENTRFDTLQSGNSTNMIFMDSVTRESYQMNYLYQQVGINASLIFRTQPQARWSLYSGIGITATASLMSATHITYVSSLNIYYIFPDNSRYYYSSDNEEDYKSETEIHNNKTNISLYAYIPLGLDFRIAKKNEFWNKMHLIMEMQPGLAFDYIPEIGSKTYGTFRGNFGLRIEI